MAKAVAIFETPSSPVSAGAASVHVRSNATSHQAAGTSGAPTSATTVPLCVVSTNSVFRAQTHGCDLPNAGIITPASQRRKPVRSMKGQKYGKPRGKTCCWTPELDEVLKTAWGRGRLHAARRAIRQLQPTWSRYSIKKRAAALGLCRPKAQPWLDSEVNHLLWSIDSNASMALIAERLGRTVAAVRKKLPDLGYTAESLGGYKVKEVADMFSVPPARVQYWIAEKLLLTKGGRITESSFAKFLTDHPKKIPFEALSPEMQNWLREMGYLVEADEANEQGQAMTTMLFDRRSMRPQQKASRRTMGRNSDGPGTTRHDIVACNE